MSSCCSSGSSLSPQACPQCGIASKLISMKTIFHQVKFPDILEIVVDSYYFCPEKNCSVGYFSQQGESISKQQLRAFTELNNNKLCFCFDINTEHYLNALKDKTAVTIKTFIIQKTKSGECACEVRNPSGQCCLASFKQLEKTLNVALGKSK